MRHLIPLIILASTLATQATRIEQSLIEINANGYNAPVRITPTNSAYAPADLSAPIMTGPTKVYTPVAGVLTISNLVQGAYTFEQAGKRLTFTVTNSLPTVTNSIRELETAGLVYGVNGSGFPGVVKVTPNDTVPNVLGAKLVAGTGVTIVTNNTGANETITLSSAGTAGAGDATLAGNNTWTGSNVFENAVNFTNVTDGKFMAGVANTGLSVTNSDGTLAMYGADSVALSEIFPIEPVHTNTLTISASDITAPSWSISDGGEFTGSGAGLTNLNASNILTGTIDAARLPTTNSNWKFEAGSKNTLVVTNGMVGIGTATPAFGLHVNGNAFVAGYINADGNISAGGTSFIGHSGRNRWLSPSDKTIVFTDFKCNSIGAIHATNTLFAITNGNAYAPAGFLSGGAVTIRSNSWTTPPTLSPGDVAFLSQDGVPMVVAQDAGGVQTTNRLDGVPAGIVTNNHAAAVTFSNDVTVASNLVVQGSSTFEALNVGELNVTNLVSTTNGHNGAVLDVSRSRWLTNTSAAITLTGVSGADGTNVFATALWVENNGGSPIALAVPDAWRTADGASSWYVTNGCVGVLAVEVYGRRMTNAAFKGLW